MICRRPQRGGGFAVRTQEVKGEIMLILGAIALGLFMIDLFLIEPMKPKEYLDSGIINDLLKELRQLSPDQNRITELTKRFRIEGKNKRIQPEDMPKVKEIQTRLFQQVINEIKGKNEKEKDTEKR